MLRINILGYILMHFRVISYAFFPITLKLRATNELRVYLIEFDRFQNAMIFIIPLGKYPLFMPSLPLGYMKTRFIQTT